MFKQIEFAELFRKADSVQIFAEFVVCCCCCCRVLSCYILAVFSNTHGGNVNCLRFHLLFGADVVSFILLLFIMIWTSMFVQCQNDRQFIHFYFWIVFSRRSYFVRNHNASASSSARARKTFLSFVRESVEMGVKMLSKLKLSASIMFRNWFFVCTQFCWKINKLECWQHKPHNEIDFNVSRWRFVSYIP